MIKRLYGSIDKIDRQFLIWVEKQEENSLIGRVYSIYDKVINVISPNEEQLFTLAIEEVVQSPQMMKTLNKDLFQQTKDIIKPGTQILRYGKKAIIIENFIWDYSNSKVWYGNITTKKNQLSQFDIDYIEKIWNFVQSKGSDSGLLSAWYEYSYKIPLIKNNMNIFTKLFLNKIEKIDIAIKSNKDEDFLNAIYEFIGLGIGLTPSGDDFILGCLTTWKYLKSGLYDICIDNRLIDKLKGRSTTVSYFMLENCIKGFVNEALLKLLTYKGEYDNIEIFLEDMLKIGSTSGTDMLIGVIFAYQHELYKKKEEQIWFQEY